MQKVFKIGLFAGFAALLVFLCFIYINFTGDNKMIAESQQKPEIIYEPKNPWQTGNPDINFANSIGGSGSETLLAVHPLLNVYIIILKSASADGDFANLKETGLMAAILSKTGIILNIKSIGNYDYSHSVIFQNKVAVAVSIGEDGMLIFIDANLNLTINPVPKAKHLAASDNLYLFSENTIFTYPATENFSFEGDIIEIHKSNEELIIFTKQNKDILKYTLAGSTLTLVLQFLDTTFIKLALNGEILITQLSGELILSKIKGDNVEFVTAIPAQNDVEIIKTNTGYAVLTKGDNNYLYFLCLHGDIISKTQTPVTATEIQNRFVSVSSVISFVDLKDIYTLTKTLSIFGDIAPQKIILEGNLLFVQTKSFTLDYEESQGESDIFIFSLNLPT